MTIDKNCFSDIYRTCDGSMFYTFHFQLQNDKSWWFSYRKSRSYHPSSNDTFTQVEFLLHGNTYEELRQQAGEFAESLHSKNENKKPQLALPTLN